MEKSKRTFRGSYPAYALTYFFFYWSLGVFTSVLSMYPVSYTHLTLPTKA